MIFKLRSILLVIICLCASSITYAQNPDDGFECNPMPIPTRPIGPTTTVTWAWFDDMYELTARSIADINRAKNTQPETGLVIDARTSC